jgi:hypothetical protein
MVVGSVSGGPTGGGRSAVEHRRWTSLVDHRRRWAVIGVVVALVASAVIITGGGPGARPGASLAAMPARLAASAPTSADRGPGSVAVYAGEGTWVDAYDYVPQYGKDPTEPTPVRPQDIDAMADAGVRTLYLQASRLDGIATEVLLDRPRLAEILLRAHARGMRVVAWYLPHFADVTADLARLEAIAAFRVLDHRFDGIAVDIEDTTTVRDPHDRNRALIELSNRLRAELPGWALGAIVLPPVLIEDVNRSYWPGFPWTDLAPLYDVWLPMSYWTFRKPESVLHDGYAYNAESVRRLRANLQNPAALVHGIGGIADTVSPAEIDGFVRSLVDTGAIGGSLYDWSTMSAESRQQLADAFATGPAAGLPRPP